MDRETAKNNILRLIDACIAKGNVFAGAADVSIMLQSVEALANISNDKTVNNVEG